MTVLALVVALAAGQVANTCGPGKNCTVRSLRTTSTTLPALCVATPTNSWSWQVTAAGFDISSFNGQQCTGTAYPSITWTSATNRLSASGTGSNSWGQYGVEASLAFASFPTCNAGAAGRLLYDSTNSVWRYCNSTSWLVMTREWSLDGFFPSALVTNQVIQQTRVQTPGGVLRLSATTTAVGVGAGTVTIEVYNVTTTTVLCSRTKSCIGSLGGVDGTACSGTYTTGDDIAIRINSSACATAPAFNVSAQMSGG